MELVTLATTLIAGEVSLQVITRGLEAVGRLCAELKDAKEPCTRVYNRLVDIMKELNQLHDSGYLANEGAVARYSKTLGEYMKSLDEYNKLSLVNRLIKSKTFMTQVENIHYDLDTLVTILNIKSISADGEWKKKWEADQQAQLGALKALVESNAELAKELSSVGRVWEAQTNLRYEAERRLDKQNKETLVLIKLLYNKILRMSNVKVDDISPWYIPSDEVTIDPTPFASGSFGAVYHGSWSGSRVVVKRLSGVDLPAWNAKVRDEVLREMNLWYKLNHPHIVRMFGACHVSNPPMIVCEEALRGNLADYLATSDAHYRRRWQLLYEAALGLDYLHKAGIVHADLKLNNVLIFADHTARLADFGLSFTRASTTTTRTASTSNHRAGALRWRAPECLRGKPRFESDIYSLGMCIIEAATGEPPFATQSDDDVYRNLREGDIPEQPDELTDEQWELVVNMTKKERSKRMSLADVIARLKQFATNTKATSQSSFDNFGELGMSLPDARDSGTEMTTPAPRISRSRQSSHSSRLTASSSEREISHTVESVPRRSNIDVRPRLSSERSVSSVVGDLLFGDAQGRSAVLEELALDFNTSAQVIDKLKEYAAQNKSSALSPIAETIAHELLFLTRKRSVSSVSTATMYSSRSMYSSSSSWSDESAIEPDVKPAAEHKFDKSTNENVNPSDTSIPALIVDLRDGDSQRRDLALRWLYRYVYYTACHARIVDCKGDTALKTLAAQAQVGYYNRLIAARCLQYLADSGIGVTMYEMVSIRNDIRDPTREDINAICDQLSTARIDDVRIELIEALGCMVWKAPRHVAVDACISHIIKGLKSSNQLLATASAQTLCACIAANPQLRIKFPVEDATYDLVRSLRIGSDRQKEWAVEALCWLTGGDSALQGTVTRSGAVGYLVDFLLHGAGEQKRVAAQLLSVLTYSDKSNAVVIARAGAIKPLVELVRSGVSKERYFAIMVLGNLARDNKKNQSEIAGAGGLEVLVELSLSGSDEDRATAAIALEHLMSGNKENKQAFDSLGATTSNGSFRRTPSAAASY